MVFRRFTKKKKITENKVLNERTNKNDVCDLEGISMVNNNGPKLTSMRFVQLTQLIYDSVILWRF